MTRLNPFEPNIDSSKAALLFRTHVYKPHGVPENTLSDMDLLLVGDFWKSVFSRLGTELSPSTAYRSQTDGQSEIGNRNVEEMIWSLVNTDRSS